jgi:8-oxo-dGTP pyrophosphatase MutT (NUDIX family)
MITLEDVRAALALNPFDASVAHRIMAPLSRGNERPAEWEGEARIGSVLLLLYCHADELYLVLTRRRDDLNSHAGQISFPGGSKEGNETLAEAALRETSEEIGIPPLAVSLIGQLATIWIPPSDFFVHPFVGWIKNGERPLFTPAAGEVAEILEVPLHHLLDPATKKEGTIQRDNYRFEVPYFDVEGNMVWGATAVMLSEFVERLRSVIGDR